MRSQAPRWRQTAVAEAICRRWPALFRAESPVPVWLPALLALGFGVLLAALIVEQAWWLYGPLVLLVPAALLLGRYPFAAVLIWLLVFPLFAQTPAPTERYIYWLLHRAMIPGTLGYLALSQAWRVRTPKRSVHVGPAEAAMLCFLGLAVANILLFSPNRLQALYHLYDHLFVPFCAYWLVRVTGPREKDMRPLLWVAFLVVIVQAIVGLLSWLAPQVLPVQWLGKQGARTTGTLGSPAVYSTTLVFLSLLLFQRAMTSRSRSVRAVLLSVFALALFCVFLTFSRGSWVGAIVVLLGLAFVYPRTVVRLAATTLAVVSVLGSSVLATELGYASQRLHARDSAEARVLLLNAGVRMVEAKPLLGWGYGTYDTYDRQFYTSVASIALQGDDTSHNTYLTLMAEMGVPALSLYILPLAYLLVMSIRNWRRLPASGFWSRALLVMLWLAIADHIVASSFMDMVRFFVFGTTAFWLALGLVAIMVIPNAGAQGAPNGAATGGPGQVSSHDA